MAGGGANALAGGGMFIVFPTLLFAGVAPVAANATATFVLIPGGYAATWVYRDRLIHGWKFQTIMGVTSALGAALGSELLLHTSEQGFANLVPYLMVGAVTIFTFAGKLRSAASKHTARATHMIPLLGGQFLLAIYGGYFGAGMGVLMLVLFLVAANMDVHQASGVRMLCGAAANTIAMLIFTFRGIIQWSVGVPMVIACIAGGWGGAHLVKRLNAEKARRVILVYAWSISLWLLVRSLRG
jgi:uncharacterized protein